MLILVTLPHIETSVSSRLWATKSLLQTLGLELHVWAWVSARSSLFRLQCHGGDLGEGSRCPLLCVLCISPACSWGGHFTPFGGDVKCPIWDVTQQWWRALPIGVLSCFQSMWSHGALICLKPQRTKDGCILCEWDCSSHSAHTPLSGAPHCWCCVEGRSVVNIENNHVFDMQWLWPKSSRCDWKTCWSTFMRQYSKW